MADLNITVLDSILVTESVSTVNIGYLQSELMVLIIPFLRIPFTLPPVTVINIIIG